MAFISFLAPVLSSWLLVHLAGPVRGIRPRWAAALAEAALGAGAGAGLASLLYFFLLLAGAASCGAILVLHTVILASLGVLAWHTHTRISRTATPEVLAEFACKRSFKVAARKRAVDSQQVAKPRTSGTVKKSPDKLKHIPQRPATCSSDVWDMLQLVAFEANDPIFSHSRQQAVLRRILQVTRLCLKILPVSAGTG